MQHDLQSCILMQGQHLLICTCIGSLQKHYGAHKANQIGTAH